MIPNRLPFRLLLLLLLLGLLHFVMVVLPALRGGVPTFAAYYTASWLMVRGEFTAAVYEDTWFASQVPIAMQEPNIREIISPNLPTVAFALLPLVGFPPALAKIIFTVVSWGASWVALLLALWWTRPHSEGKALYLWFLGGSLLAWSAPFTSNLWIGQMYGLLLLALVLMWGLLMQQQNGKAGVALGIAFILKSAGTLLFLLPLLYRRWGVWWGAGVVMVGLGLASLLWMPPETWVGYWESVTLSATRPWVSVTAYQTTLGMLAHFLHYDAQWNPAPLFDLPWLVRPLYLGVTLVAVGITLWRLYRSKAPISLAVALLLILTVISVPFAEEYHFMLLLLPLVIVVQQGRVQQQGLRFWGLLSLIGLLLLVPLPYEHPLLNGGWWALLAYPRLYGAWLLWGMGVASIED